MEGIFALVADQCTKIPHSYFPFVLVLFGHPKAKLELFLVLLLTNQKKSLQMGFRVRARLLVV